MNLLEAKLGKLALERGIEQKDNLVATLLEGLGQANAGVQVASAVHGVDVDLQRFRGFGHFL